MPFGRDEVKSTYEAIPKMERRVNRSKRKIKKKKLISEFGIKAAKVPFKAKVVPSSSQSSIDIQNRNSFPFNNATKVLEAKEALGIELKGGRNSILKRFLEMEEEENRGEGESFQ